MKYQRLVKVMCLLFLVNLLVMLSQKNLMAEEIERVEPGKTVYVKPSSEVALRRGKGTEFKIIALVKDGSAVQLVEEGESYAKVRLANEKEGWMLTRFLNEEPPLEQQVISLQNKNDKVIAREAELRQELEDLSTALRQSNTELSTTQEERDSAVQDFTKLQQATADVVKIKTDLEETKKTNEQLTEKLAVLQLDNDSLSKDKKMYWFLAGGGVLLLGMLLGRMPGPTRKRKSSLL